MLTRAKSTKNSTKWRHSDVAAGLARLPIELLHNLAVELKRLQYYSWLIFMVFYQKKIPFSVALRGCNLISSIGIYFGPRIYLQVKG